jgi:tetratricopeptide (TPR) repeat protein
VPSLVELFAEVHYRLANLLIHLRRYEAAAATYERILARHPDDPQALFQRAWCLLEVPHRREEGIAGFQTLLQHSPSSGGYYLLACALQQESRHDEAVEAFREVIGLDGNGSTDFFHNYAISLEAVRRYEDAADAYRNAARLDPSDATAWSMLGAMMVHLGRWKDAAQCQERTLRLAPTLDHALHFADTLYELNRLDEAEQVLRDAIRQVPRSSEAKERLATVLTALDRYDEALRTAREVCDSTSNALSSRLVLAAVLSEAGRPGDALAVARGAVDTSPHEAMAHAALGRVYVKIHDGASALAAFDRMAACLPDETERLPSSPWVICLAGRGEALSILGRHHEAVATFDELRRIDPDFLERWPEVSGHYERSARLV